MSGHAAFNDAIRRAAGRGVVASPVEPDPPPKPGNIGIGRGGAAAGRPRRASANALVNERIRRGARIVREAQVRGGVSIGDFDLWG